jgi:hypothetical protein
MNLNRKDDWHMHLTVLPRERKMLDGYVVTCDKLRWKPKVIEHAYSVQELVPTQEVHGEELGKVLILLHDVGKFFALSGWIVQRAKIEGRQREDALYAETHVLLGDDQPFDWPVSRSLTSGKTYGTIRSADMSAEAMSVARGEVIRRGFEAKWEYAVYDSNRAMDRAWFASWGKMG